MQPSVIVWDLETVPDLGGFVAANGVASPLMLLTSTLVGVINL